MKQTGLIVRVGKRQKEMLEQVLAAQGDKNVITKLEAAFQELYEKYVSPEKRQEVDALIQKDEEEARAAYEAERRFSLIHIRENGEDFFFRDELSTTTFRIAERYRDYVSEKYKNRFENLQEVFWNSEAVDSVEFLKCANNIHADERVRAIAQFDLDQKSVKMCNTQDGIWKKYQLYDFEKAIQEAAFGTSRSETVKEKSFAKELKGRELEWDGIMVPQDQETVESDESEGMAIPM